MSDTNSTSTGSYDFFPARKKLALLFLFTAIIAAGGAGLVFDALRLHDERDILLIDDFDVGYYAMLVSGAAVVLIAAPISLSMLFRLLYPKPVITFDRSGVIDRRRMKKPIPLDEISGFEFDPRFPDLLGLYTHHPEEYETIRRRLKHRLLNLRRRSPRRFNLPLRLVRISPLHMLQLIAECEKTDILLAYADALYNASRSPGALDDDEIRQIDKILKKAAGCAREPREMVNTARWYIGDGPMPENKPLTDRLLDGAAKLAPEKTLYWVRRFATPSSSLFNPALAQEMNQALRRMNMKSLALPAINSPDFKRIDLFEGREPPKPRKTGPVLKHLVLAALALAVLAWAVSALIQPPFLWDKITIYLAVSAAALFGCYEALLDLSRILRRR